MKRFNTKTITVNVTQEDIDAGEATDCSECPVALAVRRIAPNARVYTDCIALEGQVYANINRWGKDFIILPPEAVQFIHNFDLRRPAPRPFSFTLQVPE